MRNNIARIENGLVVVSWAGEEVAGKTVECVVKLMVRLGLQRSIAPFIYTRIKREIAL